MDYNIAKVAMSVIKTYCESKERCADCEFRDIGCGSADSFIQNLNVPTIQNEKDYINIYLDNYGECKNCKFYDTFTGVCFNGESNYRGDITNEDTKCTRFEIC